jgi:hypothetical protein
MTSTELRIGNYVQYSNEHNVFILQVDTIYAKKITILFNSNPTTMKVSQIQGIPLTEEILLKCGFSEVEIYENVYHRDYFRISLDKEGKQGLVKYGIEDYHVEVEVKSVHQLQNLYFALIGKELPVAL